MQAGSQSAIPIQKVLRKINVGLIGQIRDTRKSEVDRKLFDEFLKYFKNEKSAFLSSGAYKLLFKIEGKAMSIEFLSAYGFQRRRQLQNKLKQNCHLLLPEDMNYIKLSKYFLVYSTFKYCAKGDLFDARESLQVSRDKKVELMHELGQTLCRLHEDRIYLIDIKPENILVCECDGKLVFTFADLDDLVFDDETANVYTFSHSYQVTKLQKINKELASEYIDWMAFSMVYLFLFLGIDEQQPFESYKTELTNILQEEKNKNLAKYFTILFDRKLQTIKVGGRELDNSMPEDEDTMKRMVRYMASLYTNKENHSSNGNKKSLKF